MKQLFTPKSIALALLFLFLISLRFLYLNAIPAGLAHDEIIYSLNRQTLLLNGTDSGGNGLPLAFFGTKTEGNISILPVLLNVPLLLFAPSDQFFARFPYVIINILTAVTLFFFTYYLLKNKTIAILASILFLINPWSFFLSRFATDSPYALFFILLGLTTALRLREKFLLIPILCFVMGFFSYHGAKIAFLPIVIILLIFLIKAKVHPKLSKKEATIVMSAIAAVCLFFFLVNALIPASIIAERKDELFFLNQEKIAKIVDTQRSLMIENPFTPVFLNKYTVGMRMFFERYITAFSPTVLFLSGDTRLVYSYGQHGLFYFFDLFFIIVGFSFLWVKERKKALFLLALILVAPLASSVSGVEFSYVHRSFLLLPLLLLLSAVGLYTVFKYASQKIHYGIVFSILACIVIFPALYFFHFYFYRYPITNGEYYSIDERILSKFIKESEQQNRQIVNIVDNPENVYMTAAFYANESAIYRAVISHIEEYNKGNYAYRTNTFRRDCPKNYNSEIVVMQWDKTCLYPKEPQYVIRNPKDGGIFYRIYNSNLCADVTLAPWRRYNTIEDYAIEKMDRKMFCERWISIQ